MKTLKLYITLFLIGGFIGSIIDTIYRSVAAGEWTHVSYFGQLLGFPVPFMPVYAAGLVILYFLVTTIETKPLIARILIYAAAFTALEYISGSFTVATLGERLWDYSGSDINLNGHVDLLHTIYWVLLGLIAENIIQRYRNARNRHAPTTA